jgi:SulP family sulfate permease
MDRLCRAHFLSDLTGQVFQAQYDAFTALSPDTVASDQAKPVMS